MRLIILILLCIVASSSFSQIEQKKSGQKKELRVLPENKDTLPLLSPATTTECFRQGNYYMKQEQADSAIFWYEKIHKKDSSYTAVFLPLAEAHFQKQEYAFAIDYGRQALTNEKTARGHMLMAKTFHMLNLYDSALVHYKYVTEKDSTLADAFYQVANILWFQYTNTLEAYQYVSQCIELDSAFGVAYSLRGQVLLHSFPLESISDFDQAEAFGDTSRQNHVYRAWAYTVLKEYDQAKKYLLKFETDERFSYWKFLSHAEMSFENRKYEECISWCDSAILSYPDDISLLTRKAKSLLFLGKNKQAKQMLQLLLLDNKKPSLALLRLQAYVDILAAESKKSLKAIDGNFVFKKFNADEYGYILKKSKTEKWRYENLLAKLDKDYTSLSLSEYFMLYFSYSNTSKYSALELTRMQEETLFDAINEGNYEECISVGQATLKNNPTQFPLYLPIAKAAILTNNIELARKYIYISEAFYNAILATGSGNTKKNAIVVISASHEYALLQYKNLNPGSQALVQEKEHHYDMLTVYTKAKKQQHLFFLIDKVLESYGISLKKE